MPDSNFFQKSSSFTLAELANMVKADLQNAAGKEIIHDIGTIESSKSGEITFLSNDKYANGLQNCQASACILHKKHLKFAPTKMAVLISDNPYCAYAIIAAAFYPDNTPRKNHIASSAIVPDSCTLGSNIQIGHNVVIGNNVQIGNNTIIGDNSVVGDNVILGENCNIKSNVTITYSIIGDNCTFYSGVRIGQDGFGFAPGATGIIKVPQLGRVIIGKNVEIGANSCIDRGAINDTIIGDGCKIDNLVQIGHNCIIGKNCLICGQVGIAGSVTVGDGVMFGGQVGVGGHLVVGSGSMIAAQSGVASDVEPKSTLGGSPAMPIKDWHRSTIIMKKLIKNK